MDNYGHQDSENWIWGIFYFNRKDPRLFPPKKKKFFGWTVNFANPYSILALLSLLVVIFVVAKLLLPQSSS